LGDVLLLRVHVNVLFTRRCRGQCCDYDGAVASARQWCMWWCRRYLVVGCSCLGRVAKVGQYFGVARSRSDGSRCIIALVDLDRQTSKCQTTANSLPALRIAPSHSLYRRLFLLCQFLPPSFPTGQQQQPPSASLTAHPRRAPKKRPTTTAAHVFAQATPYSCCAW